MIFLKNYSEAKLALEYDPQTGKRMEIARELVTAPFARGFYVRAGGDLVGVYASPAGPVFFVNGERYEMKDPAFGVEHHRGEREHQFTARCGGELIYELQYPPRTDWGYDNWSADEESADWFLWLAGSVAEAQFYRYYTTE